MKKPMLKSNNYDEINTPIEALYPLLPYINKKWRIWECAFGNGVMYNNLTKLGFKVVSSNGDFFKENLDCDIIISKPPYSIKRKFIKRAFELKKPFAFLVPLTTLEGGVSMNLFKDKNIQLIIPNKRIDFIKKGSSSWFLVIWLTYKLKLPKQINYVDMKIKEKTFRRRKQRY